MEINSLQMQVILVNKFWNRMDFCFGNENINTLCDVL